jgi:hypothetical protein
VIWGVLGGSGGGYWLRECVQRGAMGCVTESDSPVGWISISRVRGSGFNSGRGRFGYLQGFAVEPYAIPTRKGDPPSHRESGWERPIEYEGRKVQRSES